MIWILLLGVLAFGGSKRRAALPAPAPAPDTDIRTRIRAAARAAGVPERLALATARAESNFNPRAAGDLQWYLDRPRFERVVPKGSPYRSIPQIWHSYGLFQLLAPYHVSAQEDPRILFDPQVNTDRAMVALGRLVKKHGGDWDAIRLAYAGASNLSDAKKAAILSRWHTVLAKE